MVCKALAIGRNPVKGFKGALALKALTLLWAVIGSFYAHAQVSVDYYLEDGTRYVCSSQEVLYNSFSHTAYFAIEAVCDASGFMRFSLQVTYDEGKLSISRGDSLTLVLRGGNRIFLTAERDVGRSDITKRHFKDRNYYYVTCHYAMREYDIQRITRNRVTKMSVQTDEFDFDRKLDKFQDRFRRQFTTLYQYLMKGNKGIAFSTTA